MAIGDGALGFWRALDEVFPGTRHQRCWVHKVSNVLGKFPKSMAPTVKSDLRDIWQAETRAAAEAAIDTFAEKYGTKYDKAVACLVKDRDALLAFFDFPAEHSHDRCQSVVHGNSSGGAGYEDMWMCKAGGGAETTVEQTLIRGLVTA